MSTKPIYCVGFATSPRIGGNTSILLEKALEGAAAAGAKTELISLKNYRFSPCLACDGCFHKGKCVVPDDMQLIYEKMLNADRIILAAPIFSMGMCAQAKALVDRTQRFWSTKYVLKKDVIENKGDRPLRKGIFISAAGSNHKGVFTGALQIAKYFFLMLEAEYTGYYCYQQVDEKGAVLNHPTALDEVYKAGFQLAADR
jgi:multimeric flavodoxin WrbA